ncbi:hypothetical protein P3S68_014743 [Capsicum galapagoense]
MSPRPRIYPSYLPSTDLFPPLFILPSSSLSIYQYCETERAMVSPHGIKLAVYLISSYFGDLNADCFILSRGSMGQPLYLTDEVEITAYVLPSPVPTLWGYTGRFAIVCCEEEHNLYLRLYISQSLAERMLRAVCSFLFITIMFKLLQCNKKISDTTFVEKKDAVKILCKLWKDEYLEMKVICFRFSVVVV